MKKHGGVKGLSGNALKVIAMLSMLLDHIGAVVIEKVYFVTSVMPELVISDFGKQLYIVDHILRAAGRIAFPIYCFLLLEGFLHTKNIKRYLARLALFSVFSEVPFDLAMSGQIFSLEQQNVFFTLTAALFMLYVIDTLGGKWNAFLSMTVITCFIMGLTRCDYGIIGPIMVAFMYLFRNEKKMFYMMGILLAGVQSVWGLFFGIFAYIPIYHYNGKGGNVDLQIFSYFFYPLHLSILVFIRAVVFIHI